MTIYRDYDSSWRISGHEEHAFTSEADARAAVMLAFDHSQQLVSQACAQESRYRRAAERAKEKVAV